jgi:ABC-type bacteriocin/lantibiotic exporter with double-glycine peptidase domain
VKRILASALALLALGPGCSTVGTSRPFDPAELDAMPGWVAARDIPFQRQKDDEGSGIAALDMIFGHWKIEEWPRQRIEASCPVLEGRGTRARDLRRCAREAGLDSHLVHGSWDDLLGELRCGRPVVVGLVQSYRGGPELRYVVVAAVHPRERLVATLDPARGWRRTSVHGFQMEWEGSTNLLLVFLGRSSARGITSGPDPHAPRDADSASGSRP